MKLSLFHFAALAPTAAAAQFSLRSTLNQMFSTAKAETYDARIVVSGLTSSMTKDEVNYVSKQAAAAFNSAFGLETTGQKIGDIEARGSSNLTPDSFWWETSADDNNEQVAALINAAVELWSYKGESDMTETDSAMFDKFEEDLCDRLRTSGFRNLAAAKDCSFSFVGKPGLASQLPVDAAYPSGNKQVAEAQLAMVGLKQKMDQADSDLLNKVILSAHKEAFGKSGLSLAAFQTLVGIPVEGHHSEWLHQCPFCCWVPDDDRYYCPTTYDAVTLVMANVVPLRSSASSSTTGMDAQFSHEAFETFVCTKLRNSGNSNFENVHDCSFNFVYGM